MDGYGGPASYRKNIAYDISMEQIVAIINQSQRCEQFIKYECHHSVLFYTPTTTRYGWWVSRDGKKMKYWGGAEPGNNGCACGMTNSCARRDEKCNCDTNDRDWREDGGYLTDKSTLPVIGLRFGDTYEDYEYGYHTLGKLQCWGYSEL